MKPIVQYKKWWHRFIPSKRRQLKIMQALIDHMASKPDFQEKVNKYVTDYLVYGIEPKEMK